MRILGSSAFYDLIGPPGPRGTDGVDGASAYEVAVAEGFVGTEADWLASLVGPKGDKGDGVYDDTAILTRLAALEPTPIDWPSLFGETNTGFVYIPAEPNTLFRDLAQTIPTGLPPDESVRLMRDLSGANRHAQIASSTLSVRPIRVEDASRTWLYADGSNDYLDVNLSGMPNTGQGFTLIIGLRKLRTAANFETVFGTDENEGNAWLSYRSDQRLAFAWTRAASGTLTHVYIPADRIATGIDQVITLIRADGQQYTHRAYAGGDLVDQNSSPVAANMTFGTTSFFRRLRNANEFYGQMRLYGAFAINRALTDAERVRIEIEIAKRSGSAYEQYVSRAELGDLQSILGAI